MLRSQTRLILVSFIGLLTIYLVTLNLLADDREVRLTDDEKDVSEPAIKVIAVSFDLKDSEEQDSKADYTNSPTDVKAAGAGIGVRNGGEFPAPRFELDELRASQGARSALYVWCGRNWFQFEHYLSVRSAFDRMAVDRVVFEYRTPPVLDYWLYNTWFDELKRRYPFFVTRKLADDVVSLACLGDDSVNRSYVVGRLASESRGAVYVDARTVFDRYPARLRNVGVVNGVDEDFASGFLATDGQYRTESSLAEALAEQPIQTDNVCSSALDFNSASRTPICFYLDPKKQKTYPYQIWTKDSNVARSIRKLMYSDPEPVTQRVSSEDLVPNIAHLVWLGGGPMDFLFYLCVLSLIYVAEVDTVYIHGDAPPTGRYWNMVKDLPQIKLIYRENAGTIYGTDVSVISHVTDIWRVDFMLKYGGIYIDTDAVFVQKLTKKMRSYDVVGSYDWTYWNAPFPDTINFGVMLGKKGAPYFKHFMESMRWFKDDDWAWNGLRQPYKIQERYPQLIRVDPHLQTICYLKLCHPTWWKGYHDENQTHVNPIHHKGKAFNWRKDTFAMHWTLPTPPELMSKESVIASKSQFADIAKYILGKAGVL